MFFFIFGVETAKRFRVLRALIFNVLYFYITMIIRKPNIILLLAGILAILMFVLSFYLSWTDRNIRLKGELRKVKIGNINYGKGRSADVIVDNIQLSAGRISRKYSVGDSILVRYIPNEYCVVQERVDPNRYYLYFAIESILLIVGITFIVESFKRKRMWEYLDNTIDFKELGNNILKWITRKIKH